MDTDLNIKGLLMGHATQLRYVKRFGTARSAHPESVAEHSYYCAFYALLVHRWCIQEDRSLSWTGETGIIPRYRNDGPSCGEVLSRALLHDLEEAQTGDFPRPFKYSSPELHMALDEAAGHAMKKVIRSWTENTAFAKWTFSNWLHAKDDTIAGSIVAFADGLSCLSYILQEIVNNNDLIFHDVTGIEEYIYGFNTPRYEFIRPLVLQLGDLASEWIPKKKGV